jgi:hypothetical protein
MVDSLGQKDGREIREYPLSSGMASQAVSMHGVRGAPQAILQRARTWSTPGVAKERTSLIVSALPDAPQVNTRAHQDGANCPAVKKVTTRSGRIHRFNKVNFKKTATDTKEVTILSKTEKMVEGEQNRRCGMPSDKEAAPSEMPEDTILEV